MRYINFINEAIVVRNVKKICVVGTGYVGSVTGACLAEKGNYVVCVDNQPTKIAQWNSSRLPLVETGLDEIVFKNRGKRLFFSSDSAKAIKNSEIIFECVNTPQKEKGLDRGSFDMQYVDAVAREIARYSNSYKIVVQKSTVPCGTARRLEEIIKAEKPALKFSIVSNPEFLAEGSAVKDFMNPDRTVIGLRLADKKAKKAMADLYSFVAPEKMLYTTIESAELIKLASNAMLANRISLINSIAQLCEKTGGDIEEIAKGVGMDKRIGPYFLKAGIGFGGSCFKKDLNALVHLFNIHHLAKQANFFKNILDINQCQRENLIIEMKEALFSLPKKTVAVYGISFKPDTDDLRDAPAIDACKKLMEEGALLKIYDPQAMHKIPEHFKSKRHRNYSLCEDPYDAAIGADAIALVTDWNCFKSGNLDLKKVCSSMNRPAWIFDCRNIYDPQEAYKLGFNYVGVGRQKLAHK